MYTDFSNRYCRFEKSVYMACTLARDKLLINFAGQDRFGLIKFFFGEPPEVQ